VYPAFTAHDYLGTLLVGFIVLHVFRRARPPIRPKRRAVRADVLRATGVDPLDFGGMIPPGRASLHPNDENSLYFFRCELNPLARKRD
jgi:hypothetical protein